MQVTRSADGVVTVYTSGGKEDVEVSVGLSLPGGEGFEARSEGFQFMLDKKAALKFAEDLKREAS